MTKKSKGILVFSLLAAGAGAAAIGLMLEASPVGARPQPERLSISLGRPSYGGTGCPGGTARATLSPDRRSISILFDQYVAETRPGLRFDRKSCNIAVPIDVPRGLSVSLLRLDYRGFVKVPRGGRGQFRAEYFFAGITGPTVREDFRGGFEDDYLITDRVAAPLYSRCGEPVTARVNSSISMEKSSPTARPEGLITVDSTDITAEGIIFYLDVRSC